MPTTISRRSVVAASILFFALSSGLIGTSAQEKRPAPDISVAGVKLGDRVSAKAFLGEYQMRTDGGVPSYYFYNSRITSVLKLTAASFEDPYLITEIEVFNVGPEYQHRHFVLDRIGTFATESGIFIGFRQKGKDLVLAMMIGIPNVGRSNIIGPKDVISRIGEPNERVKNGDEELFDYSLQDFRLPGDSSTAYRYSAHYRFYERKLNRFSIKIEPAAIAAATKAQP